MLQKGTFLLRLVLSKLKSEWQIAESLITPDKNGKNKKMQKCEKNSCN